MYRPSSKKVISSRTLNILNLIQNEARTQVVTDHDDITTEITDNDKLGGSVLNKPVTSVGDALNQNEAKTRVVTDHDYIPTEMTDNDKLINNVHIGELFLNQPVASVGDVLNQNEAKTQVVTDHDYIPTEMTDNDKLINNVHIGELFLNQPVASVGGDVHESTSKEVQGSTTSAEVMLEKNLLYEVNEADTLHLPFSDIDCLENESFVGNVNVVGAEFTISEVVNGLVVEDDVLFQFEAIDQLDLNHIPEENKTDKEFTYEINPNYLNGDETKTNERNDLAVEAIDQLDLNLIPEENKENKTDEEFTVENDPNYLDGDETKTKKSERKRKKKSEPESWEKNQIKKARMTGQSYVGYSRKKTNDKYIIKKDSKRKERKMGPECLSTACRKSKIKKCRFFSLNQRQQLFNKFWTLSWEEKSMMVSGLVSLTVPKQTKVKTPGSKSRKTSSFTYHLQLNNDRVKVCKPFFLSTLGVNEWMVQNWVKKHSNAICNENEETVEDEDDPAVVVEPEPSTKKKRKSTEIDERMEQLKTFFDNIPKMPSHYCRRSTQKQYLETNVGSKANLYRLYVEQMKEESKPFYSEFVFHQVFDSLNLSIFQPRKDRCDICYGYETKNIDKEIWEKHIEEKDRARMEKEIDKEKAEAKEIYCLTMDLQAVKCAPNIKASESYYKTKLACHNFTIYNLANNHCTNYWWNESEGDLCASVFANYIINYLSSNCLEPKLPIVVFSDGCGYQNRNCTLANALLRFAKDNNVEVTQKFLCKGHTQMECDSVHATIERKLKGKDIFVPFQYVQLTKSARKNPEPYEVKYITHSFFSDFTFLKEIKSIRPGLEPSDPKVVDLRALKYTPEGLLYKLDFDSEFAKFPERETRMSKVKNKAENQDNEGNLPKLFKSRLPIKLRKWNDLQDLKGVIPADYHAFYDSLPKQCSAQNIKSPKQRVPENKVTNQKESKNYTNQKFSPAQNTKYPKQRVPENKVTKQNESKNHPNQKFSPAQNTKSPKQSISGNKVTKQKESKNDLNQAKSSKQSIFFK